MLNIEVSLAPKDAQTLGWTDPQVVTIPARQEEHYFVVWGTPLAQERIDDFNGSVPLKVTGYFKLGDKEQRIPLLTELEPDPSVAKHRAVPDVAAPPDAAGMRAIAGILPDGSKPEDQAKLPDAVDITSEEQQTTFIINYFRARGMETLQSNQEFVEGLIKSFKPTSIGAAGKPDSGVSDSAKTLIDASRRAGVLFDQVLDEEAEHEALIHWMEEKQGFIAEVFGITFQGRTQTGKQWLAEFLTERDRIKAKKNEILASAPMLAQLVELKNPKGTRFQSIPKVDLDPHVPGVSSESEYDRSLLAKPPTPENDEAIRAEFLKKLDAIHKAIHDARAQVLEGDIDFLLGLDTLRQRVKLDLGRVKGKNEGLGKQLDKMLVDKQIKDEIKTVGEFAIQIGLLFVPGGQVISAVAGFALAANELDTKLKTWDMSKAGTDPSRALADSQAADEALLNSTLKMAIQAVLLAAGVVGELRKMDGKPTPGPTDIEPPLTPAKGPPASLRDIIGEAKYKQFEEALNAVKAAHPEYADIPIDEMIAIRGYAAEDYALLNKALRAQDAAELERLSGYIQKATSGLEKLPPYAGTVNRGASMTEDMVARYVPGQTVTEAGFTSTSAKGGTPFKGNTNFIIKSKTGKDVSMISKFPKEKEILFPPGTQFKVNAVQKPAPGVNIIFLEEVPK
jgi:hypothetical protein